MKRWTWLMALMLALMIPLQGCTSNPPKDEGEEQNQQEQQKEEQEKDEETDPEEDKEPEDTQVPADERENSDGDTPVSNQNADNTSSEKAPGRRQLFQPEQQQHKPGWRKQTLSGRRKPVPAASAAPRAAAAGGEAPACADRQPGGFQPTEPAFHGRSDRL